jgi:hypothetical protein
MKPGATVPKVVLAAVQPAPGQAGWPGPPQAPQLPLLWQMAPGSRAEQPEPARTHWPRVQQPAVHAVPPQQGAPGIPQGPQAVPAQVVPAPVQ